MWTQSLVVGGESFTAALFDHQVTSLVLHANGAIPAIELPRVVGAFNGGFELGTGQSGMSVGGSTSGVFQAGMAAVVAYADGSTGLGAWGRDVPAPGQAAVSARSNLHLLVDGGQPASDASALSDWGAVLHSAGSATARASLGQLANGDLLWVGSMSALPGPLADAQVALGAVHAMQLDINPEWVALFSFTNGVPQAVLPGQNRPATTYLAGWSRDFFTIDAR